MLSSDWHPIHADAYYAASSALGQRVFQSGYGVLLALGIATRFPEWVRDMRCPWSWVSSISGIRNQPMTRQRSLRKTKEIEIIYLVVPWEILIYEPHPPSRDTERNL